MQPREDVNFATQALKERVARHKLAALGVRCDDLTAEQEAYLLDWRIGS